jgi:hypothetical protein
VKIELEPEGEDVRLELGLLPTALYLVLRSWSLEEDRKRLGMARVLECLCWLSGSGDGCRGAVTAPRKPVVLNPR